MQQGLLLGREGIHRRWDPVVNCSILGDGVGLHAFGLRSLKYFLPFHREREKKKRSLYLGLPRTGEFINFSFDFLKTYPYDFVQVMGLGLVNLYKVHRSWTGREKLEIQFQK